MPPRRQYRKRRSSSSDDEGGTVEGEQEAGVSAKLEETREVQKLRKKPVGMSAVGLAFGKKFTEEEKLAPDPFKLKTGGLVDLRDIRSSDLASAEDEVVQRLSANFSAETKTHDDEVHMLKYIEDEMAKRKEGMTEKDKTMSSYEAKIDALYQVPDRLLVEEKEQSEDMLSNQMLSGIPEVNLGLEAKFRNIEETELAKRRMVTDQKEKKPKMQSLVPTNMAVNYTLHSLRFYKKPSGHSAPKQEASEEQEVYIPVVGESEPELKAAGVTETHKRKADHSQMATDDIHYDKYRKKVKHF